MILRANHLRGDGSSSARSIVFNRKGNKSVTVFVALMKKFVMRNMVGFVERDIHIYIGRGDYER